MSVHFLRFLLPPLSSPILRSRYLLFQLTLVQRLLSTLIHTCAAVLRLEVPINWLKSGM